MPWLAVWLFEVFALWIEAIRDELVRHVPLVRIPVRAAHVERNRLVGLEFVLANLTVSREAELFCVRYRWIDPQALADNAVEVHVLGQVRVLMRHVQHVFDVVFVHCMFYLLPNFFS